MNTTESAAAADAQRKIANRLRRAHGQLAAVIAAVESDAHCRDVIHQLSAVSKALDRAGYLVISTALAECLANPEGGEERNTDAPGSDSPNSGTLKSDTLNRDELEKLFLSLA